MNTDYILGNKAMMENKRKQLRLVNPANNESPDKAHIRIQMEDYERDMLRKNQ